MVIMVKYGPENTAEVRKISFAEKGDTIVLIQDGIFWLAGNRIKNNVPEGIRVVAVKNDYLARGYNKEDAIVPLINYDELIEIFEKDNKTIS